MIVKALKWNWTPVVLLCIFQTYHKLLLKNMWLPLVFMEEYVLNKGVIWDTRSPSSRPTEEANEMDETQITSMNN